MVISCVFHQGLSAEQLLAVGGYHQGMQQAVPEEAPAMHMDPHAHAGDHAQMQQQEAMQPEAAPEPQPPMHSAS